jgi:putative hydrolase of the HAD superfamily
VATAVIFDFSGTLFRCEDGPSWVRAALRQAGIAASEAEVYAAAARLAASGGQPGARTPFTLPPHVAGLWERRDLSAAAHRAAYTALIDEARLPWPGLTGLLYERHAAPQAWLPYPDTVAALELLADRGIPVAVLSNIGWDLRHVFRHHGADHLVADYVLSFEQNVAKPGPRIFATACELLGRDPADVLMVGDDPAADGGATAIGCAFRAVAHVPVADRPDALLQIAKSL